MDESKIELVKERGRIMNAVISDLEAGKVGDWDIDEESNWEALIDRLVEVKSLTKRIES